MGILPNFCFYVKINPKIASFFLDICIIWVFRYHGHRQKAAPQNATSWGIARLLRPAPRYAAFESRHCLWYAVESHKAAAYARWVAAIFESEVPMARLRDVDLHERTVLAIQNANTQDEQYALFCADGGVYHGNKEDGFVLLAVLENIRRFDGPIKMYYHFPYLCVTERYGLNAATVDIRTGQTRSFAREDYHCDVSSYSAGFLEHQERVLLIHQTQWNRLDISDLETGELLTKRQAVPQEAVDDIDYFHSLLHVSPDGKHFLSNGWIWHPVDHIRCFETARFLKEYESCEAQTAYYSGYAWDRPCTFVGNDGFVLASDQGQLSMAEGVVASALKEPPAYHQLLYYQISEVEARLYTYSGYENQDTLPLAYSGKADCDVFAFDEYGEITGGELHYDAESGHLVALSEKGAFALALDGRVLYEDPDIRLHVSNWALRQGAKTVKTADWMQNWQYDTLRRSFYRFHAQGIEKKLFPQRVVF